MKRRISLFLTVLFAAAVLAGCGASSSGAAVSGGASETAAEAYEYNTSYDVSAEAELQPQEGRKIVYTADLTMETRDYAATRQALLDAAAEMNGYISSSSEGGSADQGDRWVRYTLRIPAENYNEFLSVAAEAGSLTHKSEYTDDITAPYLDVEARLNALEMQRDRLNELAAQAETTSELLEIESQLSEVQYQIESYTAQQRSYDDQVDYATVNISLNEVQLYTPTSTSFGERFAAALAGGWSSFVGGVQEVLILLAGCWPLVLLAAAVLIVLHRLGRKRRAAAPFRGAKPCKPYDYAPGRTAPGRGVKYAAPASPAAPAAPTGKPEDSAPEASEEAGSSTEAGASADNETLQPPAPQD